MTEGTQFGTNHRRPADCITYQCNMLVTCCVTRHECYICSVIAVRGSLKVTAVADALKGRGGGKYVWAVTRISFVLFLCYVLFLFSMLLYCNVSLLVT